jgi:F-type H+-transporting ATPase subunit gamma
LIDPEKEKVKEEILFRYLLYTLHLTFLDSLAGEHGARMSAMDSASRNASEMIRTLTLAFNRARQASITAELLDIINGKNAVESV